jgi:predicted nucleic acid-binding protein
MLGEKGHLAISTQVLVESYSVLTRKRGMSPQLCLNLLVGLSSLDVVETSVHLVYQAMTTANQFQISIWDAQILEAAATANARYVLTEDLSDGQEIRGVQILNPFEQRAESLLG